MHLPPKTDTEDRVPSLERLLRADLDEAQKQTCLRRLALDTVDADILAYAVELFRARMIPAPAGPHHTVDLCGTGGDRSGSFNISTTAALVTAGADAPVAKHGNVSITGKSGSIDLLRALDIPVPETPDAAGAQMENSGIMFLFAPLYHPAFTAFAQARKVLAAEGVRTVFNLLGPLLNPACPRRAVAGVFAPHFVTPMAEALARTGTKKGMVFHGDGMDELSLTGTNSICIIENGALTMRERAADSFGLSPCTAEDLRGGTPADNAAITLDILERRTRGAKRDMVILNAGAALWAASDDPAETLEGGIARAQDSIESGAARAVLERLRT